MIILCFQGCGKTCLADKSKGIIDLDSRIANRMCMVGNGKNIPNWPVMYVDTLLYLDKQGYTVLGNISRAIIDGLDHAKVKFHIITPDTTLKEQWLDKLRTRYNTSKDGNDLAAWQMAITDFDYVYKDMSKRDNVTFIKDMDYSLEQIIDEVCGK